MKIARRAMPAEIPTASMADVAFLLIIFFLVASFYSVTRGIQFSLPKHEPEALIAEPGTAVLIQVAADGSLVVDRRPMALTDVQAYVRERLRRNPEKSVIMQTSLDAPYSAMTDVLDELRQVGVRNIIVPTSQELALYGLESVK
jgi:biopolymer transport protein ExbD